MTPAARMQAAAELLDAIIVAARDGGAAADSIARRFFAARRYAGSTDRRAIRDLAWRAVRRFGERPASGRAALVAMAAEDGELAALFGGGGYGPEAIAADEPAAGGGPLPAWLLPLLDPLLAGAAEQAALLDRAPLDLRVNRLKSDAATMRGAFPEAQPVAGLPDALRLPTESVVDRHPAFLDGLVEIQDAASQHFVAATGARPGMAVLDLCAGGGGKTLALAAAMGNRGRLIASDIARDRLAALPPRAARAGADVETRLLDPGREAAALADLSCDLVLVDAPCSGSGTWRRNPETRWRLTPARLDRLGAEQARLLDLAAARVALGGRLAYAVCSLLRAEGMEQVAAFLARHPGWRAVAPETSAGRKSGEGRLLTPAHDGCDGFFFALLARP